MPNDKMVLAALTRKTIYHKYSRLITPGYFADAESRKLYEQLGSLHDQTSENVSLDVLGLPDMSDWNLAKPIAEDFALRCYLNQHQIEVTKKINTNKLISQHDVVGVIPELDMPDADMVVWDGTADPRPFYPIDSGIVSNALDGGVRAGELVLISCPPWGGKTHWLVTFCSYLLRLGHPVIHFILEDIPHDVVKYYETAIGTSRPDHLAIVDANSSVPTVGKFDHMAKKLLNNYTGHLPPVIVIDYADIVADKAEDDVIRLRSVCQGLRRMANRQQCMVFSARQSDTDAWDNPQPTMKNLSGSKIGTGATADVIIFFSQLEHEKNLHQGRIILAKARGRPAKIRTLPVLVDFGKLTYSQSI